MDRASLRFSGLEMTKTPHDYGKISDHAHFTSDLSICEDSNGAIDPIQSHFNPAESKRSTPVLPSLTPDRLRPHPNPNRCR